MPFPRKVEAVLFDMDGLLLDTERYYQHILTEAAAAVGFSLTPQIFISMVGTPRAASQHILRAHFGNDFPLTDYYAAADRLTLTAFADGVPLKAGAQELIEDLASRGIPMAVGTSTGRLKATRHLNEAGLMSCFAGIVTGDDVTRGKPAPEVFIKAAVLAGVAPESCLVLEDSHNGIRAAHAAGAMPVMVPDLLPATDEMREKACHVVADLHAVRALLRV